MKRMISFLLALTLLVLLFGCSAVKPVVDSIKESTAEHNHSHENEDEEETTPNLNFKVEDTTNKKTETDNGKETTKKNDTTEKDNDDGKDPQYPYVDVNDGDTTEYEWPKEGLAAEFPELKSGTMKKPFISDSTFSVYFANVDPVEFDKYIENLKRQGFTVDDSTDLYLYVATNDKIKVEFFYDTSKLGNNTLSLIATYIEK